MNCSEEMTRKELDLLKKCFMDVAVIVRYKFVARIRLVKTENPCVCV
jgi:hypothetical protein